MRTPMILLLSMLALGACKDGTSSSDATVAGGGSTSTAGGGDTSTAGGGSVDSDAAVDDDGGTTDPDGGMTDPDGGMVAEVCGDDDVTGTEACDDGNEFTETECAYGTATCSACDATCDSVLTLTGRVCGDSTTDSGDGETCDDGNTVTETECPYGTANCTLCADDCGSELTLTGRTCGDSTVDSGDGEACDDGNTVDETECAYGTANCTACAADCGEELTLTGRTCGDSTIDSGDGEVCDDGNAVTETECPYGTANCTLCADDCGSELTLTGRTCGDSTLDAGDGEVCDDGNLVTETECPYGMATCTACAADCGTELSLTGRTCGDSTVDTGDGEVCDDGNLVTETECPYGMATCTACAADCGTELNLTGAFCGDDNLDTADGEACDDGNDQARDGCSPTCQIEGAFAPLAGEVIVTEMMPDPTAESDADGEWFELHNTNPNVSVELQGCVLESAGGSAGQAFPINESLVIAPGGYATFAASTNPGFPPTLVTGGAITLNNSSADSLALRCEGVLIDEAFYDPNNGSPDNRGAAYALDPTTLTADANDANDVWCVASRTYNTNDPNTDRGTPGSENDPCFFPGTVTQCRLQGPAAHTGDAGTTLEVAGRVLLTGWTDATSGVDAHPMLDAQVGFGPVGVDPANWSDWTFATPNPAWDGDAASDPTRDEYLGSITLPAPGSYDYALRFSADGGETWTYCDRDAGPGMDGSEDGYSSGNAGALTSEMSSVPTPELIFSEYVEGSSFNKALEIANIGASAADLTGCLVRRYTNGGTGSTSELPLSGSIAVDDVFVVCNSSAAPALLASCDQSGNQAPVNFNGDDTLELVCGGVVLDSIGDTIDDPGAEWNSNGVGTANETIRRSCAATGDTDVTDAFLPDAEWTSFPNDTFDGIGNRNECIVAP